MGFSAVGEELDLVAKVVVDSAYKVHKAIGPGLLESIYETFLCHELKSRNVNVEKQVPVALTYKDLTLDGGLRIDILVEEKLIIELKAVEHILPVHRAQLASYLRLSNKKLGLLINFNVPILKFGISRIVV